MDQFQAPHRILADLQGSADIGPACWQKFTIMRGNNGNKLPSEIVKDPEYCNYEKELVLKRSMALEDAGKIQTAIKQLDELEAEFSAI
jgi:hypothetical protein